jgi:4-hydroxy 2-oxovalerate aldolase
MNQHLLPEICIGYHSHNNFQLAYSNCLEVAEIHDLSKRSLLLDSSVFGMGKGAGNSPTELLAMSLNDNFNKHYDLTQILEAIDINITEIFRQTPWGYSMKYFIAASNDCHPNYVSFLLDKQTLSVKSVDEILHCIAPSKKLLYDQSHIETLYLDFQKSTSDDEADYKRLSLLLQNKKVLVIGPGKTVDTEKDKILTFIKEQQPVIIAINFIPDCCKSDFVFITNSKRYVRQASVMNFLGSDIKSIATSNVTKSSGNFDFVLDYEKLIDKDAVIPDNSLLMLLRLAKLISVKNLALAGFDGYSTSRESNYFQSEMEYENIKQKYDAINTEVSTFIGKIKDKLNVEFITTTLYDVG